MNILDTNVLSELMRPVPHPVVLDWFKAQPSQSLFTTSITQAEIIHGVMLLPAGKRRSAFERAVEAMFREDFTGRILSFGSEEALCYARIAVDRERSGRPISQFDAQIASITLCAGATLVTRNVTDFEGCGLRIHNPWPQVVPPIVDAAEIEKS